MIDNNPSGADPRGGEFTKFENIEKGLLKSLTEGETDMETDDEEFNHRYGDKCKFPPPLQTRKERSL